MNTLIVGDLHAPFTRKQYMRFVQDTQKKHKTKRTVFIGDVVDSHALSFHEHNPSGKSAGDEICEARKEVARWHKAFPHASVCVGNHDDRIYRRALSFGIPRQAMKELSHIYDTPTWKWGLEFEFDGVLYTHGTGMSGVTAHARLASLRRQSAVMGHVHSGAGVAYAACQKDLIFGMNVGCGIDIRAYAFEYGKTMPQRPILGCGVVFDDKNAIFVPMDLTDKRYLG